MSNNNSFAAVVLIFLFLVLLVAAAMAIFHVLKEDKSKINKVLTATNCLIGAYFCISTTLNVEQHSAIDISNLYLDNVLASVICLWFIGMIPAGALAVLSSNIAMFACKNKSEKYDVPGFNGAMISGFFSMYVAMAYGVVLYLLGLKGRFFPFTWLT